MTDNIQLQPGEVKELPIGMFQEDPTQPREDFNEEKIEGIAASIRERRARGLRGLIQPIKVLGDGLGGYIIKNGANRYRATLLACEEVIAAELDDEAPDASPVDRLIDQVSENYNRSDLNAIELAKVIDRLRNEGGLTLKETEERLNAAGIKLQRGALTNIHRLLKLPKWGQDAIRKGELTPAHGKYLLQVYDLPELLSQVDDWIADFSVVHKRAPTTPELQDQIASLYNKDFPCIPQDRKFSYWSPKFGFIHIDPAECFNGCKAARKLGTQGAIYCGDLKCFDAKKAADEQERSEHTKAFVKGSTHERRTDATPVIVAEDGIVHLEDVEQNGTLKHGQDFASLGDASFNADGCAGCEHKKQALLAADDAMTELACFNMPCFWEKEALAVESEDFLDEIRGNVVAPWARNRIVSEHVAIDTALQFNLAAYMAIGFPDGIESWDDDEAEASEDPNENKRAIFGMPYYDDDEEHSATVLRLGLTDMQACLTGGGALGHVAEIAALAVRHMHNDQVLLLAHLLDISIDSYRVDARFLDMLDTKALLDMVEGTKAPKKSKPKSDEGADDDAMRAWLLEHAEAVGCPPYVRAAWNASQEAGAQ
ncbi:MAG: hypothetical protein CVV05_15380 [Gammaproteobacteria bacterium HGW-Gammaproteobacteria-1]|jgi:ParB/RepB/Spo0J family partition protein|nr:MAG: hypothetical protein CVV05_15380 [Gammaproteobacteria bacterium HGW-Gammaproteobacteria-1]